MSGEQEPCCQSTTERIVGTWLAQVHNHCTCGVGPNGYYGAHENGCGLTPEVDLSTLDGWAETVLSEAARLAHGEVQP